MKTEKKLLFYIWMLLVPQILTAQPADKRISRKEYIEMWKEEAVKQMLETGIPASITLAQGILESANGNSTLARYANNHFGIKCHQGWTGETFIQDDDKKDECFRKYEEAEESFRDHAEFLKSRSRYAFLFDLSSTDYKGWAHGLKKAGYATNPKYAEMLIQIIEENELYKYDRVVNIAKKEIKSEQKEFINTKVIVHDVAVHDNNIKYIIAKEGDTFLSIAKEFEMGLWQLYKYNDLGKKDALKKGDIVYLQPKRNKAKNAESHRVKQGETMHSISQLYGIKLKKLFKYNGLKCCGQEELEPGTVIFLKKV
jgi:LysM repeat protein